VTDVARQLGTTRRGLLDARLNGTFSTRHVAGLGGVGGKPRPILSTDRPLDRAARSFLLADRAWSDTSAHAPGRIPPGLRVTLTRVPLMHSRTPRDFDRDPHDLHPEHPLNDPPAPRGKSKRLPPPQKDYVWYKWKGDDFVGYDWRANNPQIAGQHFKHQRELAQIRERKRQHRAENPKPSRGAGSEMFRGWRWLCPRCGRKVNLLFLPLPRVHLLGRINSELRMMNDEKKAKTTKPTSDSSFSIHHSSFLPSGSSFIIPNSSFACEKCHKIRRVSRCDPNAWNEIVTWLSAGLLYGREVERPAWFPKAQRADRVLSVRTRREGAGDVQAPTTRGRAAALPGGLSCDGDEILLPDRATGRKIKYTPRPTRAPSARRPQIERMLLAGMSFKSIAAELGLAKGTILWHAQQVYKHHHVRTLVELAHKLNHPELVEGHRGSQTPEIRRRLLAGETVKEINTALNCGLTMIYNQRQHLRKQGVILRDARAANGGRRQALSYD
jgi:hypothetical protein